MWGIGDDADVLATYCRPGTASHGDRGPIRLHVYLGSELRAQTGDSARQVHFAAPAADQPGVVGMTHLRLWERFLNQAWVVDACSRRVVGGTMADPCAPSSSSTPSAWPFTRRPAPGSVDHPAAAARTPDLSSARRFSPPGGCPRWDGSARPETSAIAESLFAALQAELIDRRSWPTHHELGMEVFLYLEGFYNTRRRHNRLDSLSPGGRRTTRSRSE